MRFEDSVRVLRLINTHHGNMPVSDEQARAFHGELMTSMSYGEACAAVGEFYASRTDRPWMGSGDVNAIVRAHRRERMPSEMAISRMVEERGLSGEGAWQFRRSLLKALGRGVPEPEAVRLAVESARVPVLSAGRGARARPLPAGRGLRRVGEDGQVVSAPIPQDAQTARRRHENPDPTNLSNTA